MDRSGTPPPPREARRKVSARRGGRARGWGVAGREHAPCPGPLRGGWDIRCAPSTEVGACWLGLSPQPRRATLSPNEGSQCAQWSGAPALASAVPGLEPSSVSCVSLCAWHLTSLCLGFRICKMGCDPVLKSWGSSWDHVSSACYPVRVPHVFLVPCSLRKDSGPPSTCAGRELPGPLQIDTCSWSGSSYS